MKTRYKIIIVACMIPIVSFLLFNLFFVMHTDPLILDDSKTLFDTDEQKTRSKTNAITDTSDIDSDDASVTPKSERFCAYVGAQRLSLDELQRIRENPDHKQLKFLNFTDEQMSQVPALKEIVDVLAASEFPPNDRGYVTVSADELQHIKDYLTSKSNSNTLSSYVVVNGNLYSINGMKGFPIDPNGESLNIQLNGSFEDRKDDFTEEIVKAKPSRDYVSLAEDDLDEIKPIKDAIEQIGTWKMNIRESKDVGDAVQRQVIDFMESESLRQMGTDPENQTLDFYYAGNYYRTEFVVC